MKQAAAVSARQTTLRTSIYGYGLAVLAHFIWGSYPVISKRLIAEVPPFSLLAVGYAVTLLIALPSLPRALHPRRLAARGVWLLLLAVMARSATNMLSIRFTQATYVQLINLMTPFAVALLGRLLLREPVPPRTYAALAISSLGSLMLILGRSAAMPERPWTSSDSLGITLALASTACLALYMLLTRRVQQGSAGSSAWEVLVQQMAALELVGLLGGWAAGESWSSWGSLSPQSWLLFGVFVLVNLLGGNLVQIGVLRYLNTSLFTSLIGLRLVSALLLGWLLLGERLSSIWQVLGALLVIGSVTWYVRSQMRRSTA